VVGAKVYITAGMHDLTENTVHVVLAKADANAPLSCVLVPRFWLEADGSLTDNGVRCIEVVDKMGLRGCANTHLTFGKDTVTRGVVLGDRRGAAFAQVAPLMAAARATTGLFGTAISTRAYLAALEYSRTRRQGRPIGSKDPQVSNAAIVEHADVQRMLLEMKSKTEAFRGMLVTLNAHLALLKHAEMLGASENELRRSRSLSQFYVPILKAYVSDQAWRVCELAIQTHGGAGFLRKHIVEQCARDVKVLSLWEGTNYIQSLDLIQTKLRFGRSSQIWADFEADMTEFLERMTATGQVADEARAIARAFVRVKDLVRGIGRQIETCGVEIVSQFATRILECIGDVCCARVLLGAAAAAARRLADPSTPPEERDWLEGKIKSCRFFVFNVLPALQARAQTIEDMRRAGIEARSAQFGAFAPTPRIAN
jgi:acyl-CoA dehydrogenase